MTVVEECPGTEAEATRQPGTATDDSIVAVLGYGCTVSSIEMLAGRVYCRCGHVRRCPILRDSLAMTVPSWPTASHYLTNRGCDFLNCYRLSGGPK